MIDYKTFKKGYLHEWVDQSQAARKAAEELAKKEVKPSLRDKYKPQNVIMTLDGKQVEFKGENEMKSDGDIYFTYDEAKGLFGKPDKDGWRLPTKEELKALLDDYPYEIKDGHYIFDNRLYLPAAGDRYYDGEVYGVGFYGIYWSSTPYNSDRAWYASLFRDKVKMNNISARRSGHSVRLVRDMK